MACRAMPKRRTAWPSFRPVSARSLRRARSARRTRSQVLGLFQAAGDEELLSQLASDVRLAEITAKDDMTQSLTRRIWWAWGGFALCWVALALWLLYAIRSRRRYRAAAHDRQRAVEAMEQAIVAKRKFLSMVNHEVRSPLQNIVASAELLAMKDSRPDSVGAIRRIRHAVTVLQGQLRDLLTIARGDAAQLPTQVETFELGELVQDVCAGLEEAAIAKGLAFQVEFPPSPVTVSADPIRIAQVLRNLVENSVRYTSAGRVRVRVEPFVSQASAAGDAASTPETSRAGAPDPSSVGRRGPLCRSRHRARPASCCAGAAEKRSCAVCVERRRHRDRTLRDPGRSATAGRSP